jgi:hypothetical protein
MDPIPCHPGPDLMIHQMATLPGIPVKTATFGPWADRSPLDRSEHARRRASRKPGLGQSRKAAVSLPDFRRCPKRRQSVAFVIVCRDGVGSSYSKEMPSPIRT